MDGDAVPDAELEDVAVDTAVLVEVAFGVPDEDACAPSVNEGVAVAETLAELDPLEVDDGVMDGVMDAALVADDEMDAAGDAVRDDDAVILDVAEIEAVSVADADTEEVYDEDADKVLDDVLVGDNVGAAGANAMLRYSTLYAAVGPSCVACDVIVSNRKTKLPTAVEVIELAYSTIRSVSPLGNSNCPAIVRTPLNATPSTVTATGYPAEVVQLVPVTLVPRYSGVLVEDENVATHMMLGDSNTRVLKVTPVGEGYTVGAVVPNASVPPVSGEKNPLVSEFNCATDTMPLGAVLVEMKSPPSGEMAMPRPDPDEASAPGTVEVRVEPYGTTREPE